MPITYDLVFGDTNELTDARVNFRLRGEKLVDLMILLPLYTEGESDWSEQVELVQLIW